MSEEFTFPEFEKHFEKAIEKFGGEKMETYNGKDVTPLWDMKGGALIWSFKYLYSAPKIEKIVFGVQSYKEKLMTYTLSIWPADEYALPIYSTFWAESKKHSYFLADLYPTQDCIMDLDYIEDYYIPLEDVFEKALKNFNTKSKRDPHWFKALASSCYITADFSPSSTESQNKIIEVMSDYLDVYHSIWEKDQPRSPEYMKPLLARKKAMRVCLLENDVGGIMLENAVGKELADLTLEALF